MSDEEHTEKMNPVKSDKLAMYGQHISSAYSGICFPQISSLTKRDIIGSTSAVSGCVFMPDGRLVVCEGNGNNMVKVFSADFSIQSEMKIATVWDAAVVSDNQVIVSQIQEQCLHLLNISFGIAKEKTIPVGLRCFGVDYKNGRIYVSCHDNSGSGGTVKIMTLTGDTLNTFNVSKGWPFYIAVNCAGDRLVVSSSTIDVFCYDNTGTSLYTYTDGQLSSTGMLFDSYDNIMVCGQGFHLLHVVNSDGTKQKVTSLSEDGIYQPYCKLN